MNNKLVIPGIVALIALVVIWDGATVVNSGHVGVVHRLGAVQPEHLPEGFHLKIPFLDSVEEVDIRLRKAENQATAASKDLQVVSTQVAVQYSLTGSTMPNTYQNIGLRSAVETTAIDPGITESVKAITAQYTAEELVTQRAQVKAKIQEAIEAFVNTTLEQKGVIGAVKLANVAITDFEFSAEFNRAIEDKVRAEQEALQAENEKLRRVTQAEAAAAERRLAGDRRSVHGHRGVGSARGRHPPRGGSSEGQPGLDPAAHRGEVGRQTAANLRQRRRTAPKHRRPHQQLAPGKRLAQTPC